LEARKNKEHFAKLLLESTIPDGEPMAFGDLTEFEVESDDDSEVMSKLTDVDLDTCDGLTTHGVFPIPEEDAKVQDESSPDQTSTNMEMEVDRTPFETSLSKAAKNEQESPTTAFDSPPRHKFPE
jgi:hypothetical protein